MKKPNCILVPVDYSETSVEALDFAILIAQHFKSGLALLAVERTTYPSDLEAPVGWGLESATEKLNDFFKERAIEAGKDFRDQVRPKLLIREGLAVQEILKAAEETKADMIVMGTHGRKGVSHALFGSVTEEVIRVAPCPVLVLRAGMPLPKEGAVSAEPETVEAKKKWLSGD